MKREATVCTTASRPPGETEELIRVPADEKAPTDAVGSQGPVGVLRANACHSDDVILGHDALAALDLVVRPSRQQVYAPDE